VEEELEHRRALIREHLLEGVDVLVAPLPGRFACELALAGARLRLLVRRGLLPETEAYAHDDVDMDAPDEAPLYAASVEGKAP
jgi:hypothetical protein